MMSSIGKQIITMHILPSTSRICNLNQAMKFDQLIEHNWEIFSLKNHAESKAGRLFPNLLLFFKTVYKSKSKWSYN